MSKISVEFFFCGDCLEYMEKIRKNLNLYAIGSFYLCT